MPRACCVQPYNPFCGALQPYVYFIAVHLHTPTRLCSCSPCSGLLECSYPRCLSSEDSKITASAVQLGFIKSHCHSHASCPSFLLLHFYISTFSWEYTPFFFSLPLFSFLPLYICLVFVLPKWKRNCYSCCIVWVMDATNQYICL